MRYLRVPDHAPILDSNILELVVYGADPLNTIV